MAIKRKTSEQAKSQIANKFNYLELIEFNGVKDMALFNDIEYGNFSGIYEYVYYEKKRHPNRSLNNIRKAAKNRDKEKIKQTNLIKFGVECPLQSETIKNKIKKTNIKKYGVENVSQNINIKNKKIKTSLKKYGVKHTLQ